MCLSNRTSTLRVSRSAVAEPVPVRTTEVGYPLDVRVVVARANAPAVRPVLEAVLTRCRVEVVFENFDTAPLACADGEVAFVVRVVLTGVTVRAEVERRVRGELSERGAYRKHGARVFFN